MNNSGDLAGIMAMVKRYGDHRVAEMNECKQVSPVDAGWERDAAEAIFDKIDASMSMISDVLEAARKLLNGYSLDADSLRIILLQEAIDRLDQHDDPFAGDSDTNAVTGVSGD